MQCCYFVIVSAVFLIRYCLVQCCYFVIVSAVLLLRHCLVQCCYFVIVSAVLLLRYCLVQCCYFAINRIGNTEDKFVDRHKFILYCIHFFFRKN